MNSGAFIDGVSIEVMLDLTATPFHIPIFPLAYSAEPAPVEITRSRPTATTIGSLNLHAWSVELTIGRFEYAKLHGLPWLEGMVVLGERISISHLHLDPKILQAVRVTTTGGGNMLEDGDRVTVARYTGIVAVDLERPFPSGTRDDKLKITAGSRVIVGTGVELA